MNLKQYAEVFVESRFEDEKAARKARDIRLQELSMAGYICNVRDYHAINTGGRVFVIYIIDPNLKPTI
jgi:hypothetical protein